VTGGSTYSTNSVPNNERPESLLEGKGRVRKKPLTILGAARHIITTLRQHSDPDRQKSTQRFFKYPVSAYGIETPVLRRIARDWQKTLVKTWDVNKAVQLCQRLIHEKHIESKALGILILSAFRDRFYSGMIPTVKKWLVSDCDNWATVDTLAPYVLSPLIAMYPERIPQIMAWKTSPVLWVRRAAVVAFIPHIRKGKYLDFAYTLSESLFHDTEDLMHKALGWMLREAGRTNKKRLEAFLLLHGPEIPRTTVRYAIEKFPEKERKHLLQETR